MIHEPDFNDKQTIDRQEIIAYLKDRETLVSIDAIILNGWVMERPDLKGYRAEQFDCLEADIRHGLEMAGYDVALIDFGIIKGL